MKKILASRHFLEDIGIIVLSILIAIILVKTNILDQLIGQLGSFQIIGAFIAGMFFTSIFTTVPALATLSDIGLHHNPILVSVAGGIGAVVGDMIIFKFVRDRFSEDIQEVFTLDTATKRLKNFPSLNFFAGSFYFLVD